jgi:hypothetical protein
MNCVLSIAPEAIFAAIAMPTSTRSGAIRFASEAFQPKAGS